jgi:phosphatidylglycerol---prolipoprotein diacylglyceryl transferase
MVPVLFRVGAFEITSFGVMVALGVLAALWLFDREARARSLPATATDVGIWAVAGGLLGAKLLWVIEHRAEEPLLSLLASRGGMSWFGGFAGGAIASVLAAHRRRLGLAPLLAVAAPAAALGQAIGRIGCLLVGDDYGRPTTLPWGMAFPEGLPPTTVRVHPTQIYEALWLIALTWLLVRWRARGVDDTSLLARYLVLAGGGRFLIEILRVNVVVAAGMTLAQWVSLALLLIGALIGALHGFETRPARREAAG